MEAKNKLIAKTLEEKAMWVRNVDENTRRNSGKDHTLECVKKACMLHALAGIKKKKPVRFPYPQNEKTTRFVCEKFFKWMGAGKFAYLLD